MNYIVSMNINKWMPENVEASHSHAALRWSAEYVQISGGVWGKAHSDVFGIKSMIWKCGIGVCDRMVWIDGDAIVHEDCPNLFDMVPEDAFGGACAIQSGNPYGPNIADAFDKLNLALPDSTFNTMRYINSGVYVRSGKHWLVFAAASGIAEAITTAGERMRPGTEEAAMNFAVYGMMKNVVELSHAFNRLGRSAWEGRWVEEDGSPNYILHLANIKGIDGDKLERLAEIDWRSKVGAT